MKIIEQKRNAHKFIERWINRGEEKQDSQSFWLDILQTVYGVENPGDYIRFEDRVHLDHTSFIDGYINETKVMIEQKSRRKNLNNPIRQSDGNLLTPFQQAKRYASELPYSERPRWIITCNFKEFYIYDMEKPNSEPMILELKNLANEYYRLDFLVNQSNTHIEKEFKISMKAGDLVGEIYNELLKQYKDPSNQHSTQSINQLCVRIVFCLYAEDSGIFGRHDMFHDYLNRFQAEDIRQAIIRLFKVLDTSIEDRDPYLEPELAQFPYVNGGMFSEENIEIPQFTNKLKDLILKKASDGFDWSEISPTIFGAVFESTLNPVTRREGGMHYTSVENIHKVIDPLLLHNLQDELYQIKQLKQPKAIRERAEKFQNKLSELTFFDPACGSGNFLTETYLSLRKLENEAIKLIYGEQNQFLLEKKIIKVSIQQFYGIEINDFAVSVAKTALWIAESQMMEATKDIVYTDVDFLPLKTYTKIIEGNALRINWKQIISPYKLNYIIGNPPFSGARKMKQNQKDDVKFIFGQIRGVGNIDYVGCWFKKAADYMMQSHTRAAFVSTNSVTQGEQPVLIFRQLFDRNGFQFNFAYRTFRWDSEASLKAHVHVVIIGFSYIKTEREIFDVDLLDKNVDNINAYLADAPDAFIQSKNFSMQAPHKIIFGSMPNDGGYLSNITDDQFVQLDKKFPEIRQFIRPYLGAQEFINKIPRYCLWLVNCDPGEWRKIIPIKQAVKSVQELREQSSRESTKKLANTPFQFGEIRQPDSEYIVIPRVSSEQRKYIPMGFEHPNVIAGDSLLLVPNANIFEFGILTSNVHMAWIRAVAGRLKSDYRYSAQIVYNNFPWPNLTEGLKKEIAKTAKAVLDARKLYPKSSLADLYDDVSMPKELLKAHQENDRIVMKAYGMDVKNTKESDCVARLFQIYENLIHQ